MGEEPRGLAEGERLSFEFTFNGKPVKAYAGDSIASALVRSGIRVFSRSMKFHRPRGFYCGANRCFSCAMRVNGVPGVRTCSTRAESGMVVETEGGVPSARFDALSVFDHILRKQFDYQSRFIRPRTLVPAYQRIVRRLASARILPDRPRSYHNIEETNADVLIVGHGISGEAATDRLRDLGVNPIVVERHGTEVFPPSIAFGFYDDGRVGVLSDSGCLAVRARAILLATGCIETGLGIVNADLPGVLLPEAVKHLVERGVSPGRNVFIIGTSELDEQVSADLKSIDSRIVGRCQDPDAVKRISGRKAVRAVELVDSDGRPHRVQCDSVVLLGPLVPYVNLAQQAGCELVSVGQFWFVKTDQDGRTSVPSVFSSGSVASIGTVKQRKASGVRTADSIARFLGAA